MKKLIALLLALMMVLVCTAALADGETGAPAGDPPTSDGTQTEPTTSDNNVVSIETKEVDTAGVPTKEATVKIKKSIDVTSAVETDTHPAVKLAFTVTSSSSALTTAPEVPQISFNDLTIDEGAGYGDLEINLPKYSYVGIYTYQVKETIIEGTGKDATAVDYAGFTTANKLEVKVTVIQNGDNLEVAGIAVRQDDVKTDDIENTYEAGALIVKKEVAGNMGDRKKSFPITITLNAPEGKTVASTVTYKVGTQDAKAVTFENGVATVAVNLAHNDTVTINNIPAGVTYTVVEDSDIKHLTASNLEQTNANAYKVENEVKTATAIGVGEPTEVTIKNTKDITIDTGIALNFAPYMMILALVLAGVALRIYRRREDN